MFSDHYVILGNHHDAWTYGALDPSSGTAALLETARAFSSLASQNSESLDYIGCTRKHMLCIADWAPRRTLVFCAFDAEEYGLIGSTEWVEV